MQETKLHTLHVATNRNAVYESGVADGGECRTRNGKPSVLLLVATDDYSAGFRAGFFQRTSSKPRIIDSPMPLRENAQRHEY